MSLFKTIIWWRLDIWLLKWCALMFGTIAGAYFSDFVKQYVGINALVAVIFAIRTSIKLMSDNNNSRPGKVVDVHQLNTSGIPNRQSSIGGNVGLGTALLIHFLLNGKGMISYGDHASF